MKPVRRSVALVLLATLVAGGFVAPLLHDARHALEHIRAAADIAAAHAGHAHDGSSAVEEGRADAGAADLCLGCHLRWSAVAPVFPASPDAYSLVECPVLTTSRPPAPEGHVSTRGPPVVA